MELYLIRHAHAVDRDLYGEDSHRPLSPRGRRAALEVGKVLAQDDVHFDEIVSSPLVRAVETAELMAVATGFEGGLTIDAILSPGAGPRSIISQTLEPRRKIARLALVGHEPSLGQLLSVLVGRPNLSLKKGAVLRLTWTAEGTTFRWAITPKQLERTTSLDEL